VTFVEQEMSVRINMNKKVEQNMENMGSVPIFSLNEMLSNEITNDEMWKKAEMKKNHGLSLISPWFEEEMKQERRTKYQVLSPFSSSELSISISYFFNLFWLIIVLSSPFISLQAIAKDAVITATESLTYRHELSVSKLTFIYESVLPSDEAIPKGADTDLPYSKITIIEGNKIIYQQLSPLQPSCHNFPSVSQYTLATQDGDQQEHSLVVFCGSDEGRHNTIRSFIVGLSHDGFQAATLDFFDSTPNIMKNERGELISAVYKRQHMLDGRPLGYPYLTIYSLQSNGSYFGFVPQFGKETEEAYLNYFKELLGVYAKSNKAPEVLGPLLAALLSTKNVEIVCHEIKEMMKQPTAFLNKSDIKLWQSRLRNTIYPDLNITSCMEN